MRLNKNKIMLSWLALVALALVVCFVFVGIFGEHETPESGVYRSTGAPQYSYDNVVPYNEPFRATGTTYKAMFDDIQDDQLPAARLNGIEPIEADSMLQYVLADSVLLVEVKDNDLIEVLADYPYLVPEAYDMLLELARRYQQRMGPGHRLRVTSCLRTRQYVAKLMRRSVVATSESCHLYGTTFDLSYSRLDPREKEALARSIQELRLAGYLYAKYEVKSPCFHITMRQPGHLSH